VDGMIAQSRSRAISFSLSLETGYNQGELLQCGSILGTSLAAQTP
jgi:hypothetical protein